MRFFLLTSPDIPPAKHFPIFPSRIRHQTSSLILLPSSLFHQPSSTFPLTSSFFPPFPLYKKNHAPIAEVVIDVNVDQRTVP